MLILNGVRPIRLKKFLSIKETFVKEDPLPDPMHRDASARFAFQICLQKLS